MQWRLFDLKMWLGVGVRSIVNAVLSCFYNLDNNMVLQGHVSRGCH